MDDEWEGFTPFTRASLNDLRERRKQIKTKKTTERYSAAKLSILKAISENYTSSGFNTDDFASEPDPSLEDGQELPQYFGPFPEDLHHCLLDDLDEYYRQWGLETFCVVSKRFGKNYVYRFSATNNLFIFSPFLKIRQWAINTILHPLFDAFVMTIILVNCIFLALNEEYPNAELTFLILYTAEMTLKMLARGVIIHPYSYLRDPWNWLDFVVIILGYATIASTSISSLSGANVSSLRIFRVVRAFKSVSIVPGLRTIVNALLRSLKPLAEVMLIMLFLVVLVALIGLQAYVGVLRRRCVQTPPAGIVGDEAWNNYVTNEENWNEVDGERVVCGNDTGSGLCPNGYLCLPDVADNPNYGYTNFDNMGFSLLTSFQLVTLDYWENVYNMILRAEGPWSILFFFMSVFLGPFYLLNLFLAVVTLAYSKENEKQREMERMRLQAKERMKRKRARRKKLEEQRFRDVLPSVSESPQPALLSVVTQMSSQAKAMAEEEAAKQERESEYLKTDDVQSNKDDEIHSWSESNWETKNDFYRIEEQSNSEEGSDSSKSEASDWNVKWRRFKSWFNKSFCWWQFPPWFLSLQTKLQIVIHHKIFELLIILCILINTIFLAIDYHGIPKSLNSALETGNQIFTAIFILEAVLKIVALGPVIYMSDGWNAFDFIIVFISIVELVVRISGGSVKANSLTVLRTLRLLRVFRLARMWQTMHKLLFIIWKSISAVGYLTLVLFLVLYIFAVIGKQVYSKPYQINCRNCTDGANCPEEEEIPRWNFGDFYHSFLLVWRVMCGEWIEPLHDCLYYTCNNWFCVPFFLFVTFIANFMILNLFTAILLEAFNMDNLKGNEENKKRSDHLKKGIEVFKKKLARSSQPDLKTSKDKETDQSIDKEANIQTGDNTPASQKRSSSQITSNIFDLTKSSNLDEVRNPIESRLSGTSSLRRNKESSVENLPVISEIETDVQIEDGSEKSKKEVQKSQENLNGNTAQSKKIQAQNHAQPCIKWCCCCCKKGKTKDDLTDRPPIKSAPIPGDNVTVVTVASDDEKEGKKEKELPDCLPKWLHNCYPSLNTHTNCSLYRYWFCIRKACFKLVKHQVFEGFILFLILASTICLAMEDIYLNDNPVKRKVLRNLEFVFTVLFTLEMVLKWIGIGPTNYFTSVWCLLDCVIVGISWAGIVLRATQASQTNNSAFRSLRTLRALRPLRAISRWQGMKVVVNALIYCIPSIGNVLCVCLLIWFVFGIMGVQFFKGTFAECLDGEGERASIEIVKNKSDCLNLQLEGYVWKTANINFDNVLNAMVALFQVATFEGWIEVMAHASDIVGVDQQPIRDNSQGNLIFFVVFNLIGSFFILNLIVGVIIESFQNLRKQTESSSAVETLLTESQKKFYKTMRTMLNRKPKKSVQAPKNRYQLAIYHLVTHNHFELAVFSLIALNMVALSMEHYMMPETWKHALNYADIVFTSLFALEAILKLIGMRLYYFRDAFNVFDFIVIVVSIVASVLESVDTLLLVSPTLLRVVRVFRVFRVLRLVRAARGIRRLVLTLMISLPALFNIAILLGVFLVIFAILGMTSFMNVKLSGALNDQVNFQTFGSSMLLLFRLVTSAGWNDVLEPLMETENCTQSTPHQSVGDCGDPVVAVIYFVSFIFIIFLVIVNMYIAIILENFDEIFQQDESGVSQGDFETFYMVWGRYDPRATQFVTLAELSNLLHDLHPPFQLPKPNLIKIGALDLPVLYGDKVHCLDVLFALVQRIMGEVEISEDMKREAEERLLKSFPNRKILKAETTTLALRQQARAAQVIQETWKEFSKRRKEFGITDDVSEVSTPSSESPILRFIKRKQFLTTHQSKQPNGNELSLSSLKENAINSLSASTSKSIPISQDEATQQAELFSSPDDEGCVDNKNNNNSASSDDCIENQKLDEKSEAKYPNNREKKLINFTKITKSLSSQHEKDDSNHSYKKRLFSKVHHSQKPIANRLQKVKSTILIQNRQSLIYPASLIDTTSFNPNKSTVTSNSTTASSGKLSKQSEGITIDSRLLKNQQTPSANPTIVSHTL